jgi:replicative DNA helicase
MQNLWQKNEPIDAESVRACLSDQKQLEAIGGVSYLAELVGDVPAASNARHYASPGAKKVHAPQLDRRRRVCRRARLR